MGRGRAKAKQTKVARELKYFSPDTDLDKLRTELAGTPSNDGDAEEYDDSSAPDDDERPGRR